MLVRGVPRVIHFIPAGQRVATPDSFVGEDKARGMPCGNALRRAARAVDLIGFFCPLR
jgi:hypothetical protein